MARCLSACDMCTHPTWGIRYRTDWHSDLCISQAAMALF